MRRLAIRAGTISNNSRVLKYEDHRDAIEKLLRSTPFLEAVVYARGRRGPALRSPAGSLALVQLEKLRFLDVGCVEPGDELLTAIRGLKGFAAALGASDAAPLKTTIFTETDMRIEGYRAFKDVDRRKLAVMVGILEGSQTTIEGLMLDSGANDELCSEAIGAMGSVPISQIHFQALHQPQQQPQQTTVAPVIIPGTTAGVPAVPGGAPIQGGAPMAGGIPVPGNATVPGGPTVVMAVGPAIPPAILAVNTTTPAHQVQMGRINNRYRYLLSSLTTVPELTAVFSGLNLAKLKRLGLLHWDVGMLATQNLLSAVDFSKLEELRLIECIGTCHLVATLFSKGQKMKRLNSLALTAYPNVITTALRGLVPKAQLKELYLQILHPDVGQFRSHFAMGPDLLEAIALAGESIESLTVATHIVNGANPVSHGRPFFESEALRVVMSSCTNLRELIIPIAPMQTQDKEWVGIKSY